MISIAHRINSINQLKHIDTRFGVEIDLRSEGNDLVLHHDPFLSGVLFEEWLEYFEHQFLILNVKEEGLENEINCLLERHNIQEYFFLGQSFPSMIKTIRSGWLNGGGSDVRKLVSSLSFLVFNDSNCQASTSIL